MTELVADFTQEYSTALMHLTPLRTVATQVHLKVLGKSNMYNCSRNSQYFKTH